MSIKVLNPTNEESVDKVLKAPRLNMLSGATVGIISNGKEGTKGYFAHITGMLYEECGVGSVVLRVKANYSAPAESDIVVEASGWDLAITGIGD